MLPLEVIGVLGCIYIFLMMGMVKAMLARKTVRRAAWNKPRRLVKGMVAKTAK